MSASYTYRPVIHQGEESLDFTLVSWLAELRFTTPGEMTGSVLDKSDISVLRALGTATGSENIKEDIRLLVIAIEQYGEVEIDVSY